jgi:putative copper resistance protein D
VLTQLLDIFGFLSVLLRGGALVLASLVVGGVIFSLWILRPLHAQYGQQDAALIKSSRRLLFCSAVALAFVQFCYVAADSTVLAKTTGLPIRDVAGANFFIAGMAGAAAALIIAAITMRDQWKPSALLLAPAVIIVSGLVATSHAAGRVEGRAALIGLGAVHVTAVAAWVGGLPYLVLGLARSQDLQISQWLCRRFSRMALLGVMVLVATAFLMSLAYIDSRQAVYGTAYGVMVASKAILLAVLLVLGAANFFLVRRMNQGVEKASTLVRRFAEAEVGIGLTIVLAAASLSSQPPAADMTVNRLQFSEIVQRFSPQWPRLDTPPISALSPATPLGFDAPPKGSQAPLSFVPGASYYPNSPGDIAWSEYNHHWAGIVVLAIGLLAFAARWRALAWARHWPLAFFGLAVFLLLRADPENWPLGPRSFWQSFAVPDVLQHRLFVILIVVFAIFEWGVATGRVRSPYASLIFPSVCAAGGALLLTHSHPLGNIKEEVFAELSHVPLAICAVIAGWARWLELRVPGSPRRIVTWIWPVCFILIGAILVNYRES